MTMNVSHDGEPAMPDPRAPIFAALQAAAPVGLLDDPGNVLAFNNLLDAFGVPREQVDRGVRP